MCLSKEDFLNLCDFYPLTAESLKIQGLKKRKMFLDYMKMKEFVSMAGYKRVETVLYKNGQI